MALSEGEIREIAQMCAQKVLEELHRYTVHYREPESIDQGLRDSMVEEKTAAEWYRKRGMDARMQGDEITANLYEHVAGEEDEHYQEFNERVDEILVRS
jgi:rubrerythrin